MHLFRPSAVLLTLLFLQIPSQAQEQKQPQGVRIFTCAHSFHIFVPRMLEQLAKSEKIEGHKLLGQQMIGGSRVSQHWNLPDERNQAKKALNTGEVDVLTLSPHVYLPDEGIDRFVELALKRNPKTRIYVQLSWHPWDSLDDKITKNEQRDSRTVAQLRPPLDKFRKELEAQVKKINDRLDRPAVFIVPVGEAVLKLREKVIEGKVPGIKKQSELFTDPIGHAKQPVMALATYCYFVAIYGRKPTAFLAEIKQGDRDQEALYRLLQDIAWETVKNYPPSGLAGEKKK